VRLKVYKMSDEGLFQPVKNILYAEKNINVFSILDGASVPDLLDMIYQYQPEHFCLFRGKLKPDIAEVTPYLVSLEQDSIFTKWVIDEGWGKHWGIFVISEADLRAMRNHFRSLLTVYSEDKPLYFRYYDPRVLRVYLPTCNNSELEVFFGPVESPVKYFILEDEDPNVALRFQTLSGELRQENLKLKLL
jgi:hypothetical protein